MANALDLQEQEQLDQFKAWWARWGNPITWVLTLVLLAFAGWNGWNWWQRDQGVKASAVADELDRAVTAGDSARAARIFADLKDRYAGSAYAQQGGLLLAKLQYDQGQVDAAKASLGWVADHAVEDEYRAVARLRLAGVLLDQKQYDQALQALDAIASPAFAALADDRRGDVLLAQGKTDAAKAAYQAAWKAMGDRVDYRRLVEAKLTALGAAPVAPAASEPAK